MDDFVSKTRKKGITSKVSIQLQVTMQLITKGLAIKFQENLEVEIAHLKIHESPKALKLKLKLIAIIHRQGKS